MIKTKAIILKSAESGEADQLLTIYSKKLGRVSVLAKGTKKLESKLRYHIEPLSYSFLILVEGRNFLILKDAVLINQFLSIKKDLDKVRLAYKAVDIIDQLIVGQEKDEEIWELILKFFTKLNVRRPTFKIVKVFQDDLLRLLGYDPNQIKNLADIY